MSDHKFEVSDELEEMVHFINPAIARLVLWEWLKASLAGGFSKDIDPEEKLITINLYEKLDKILKAVERDYRQS